MIQYIKLEYMTIFSSSEEDSNPSFYQGYKQTNKCIDEGVLTIQRTTVQRVTLASGTLYTIVKSSNYTLYQSYKYFIFLRWDVGLELEYWLISSCTK